MHSRVAQAKRTEIPLRNISVAVIGNALEWFDLIVYGFLASTIAAQFFPEQDAFVSLALSLGTFGSSFIIRPVGAVLIGRFSDRHGRKAALVLVSALMLLGTLIIAVLPTYNQIGIAAPILLLLARLIQGFSAGGEFGSATAYLAEQSPNRRAFFASWQFASQGLATLLGSCFGLAITLLLNASQLEHWGWRLPFIFGLLIGPVAYIIRNHADETPEFTATQHRLPVSGDRLPLQAMTARVLTGTGMVLVATVSMYLMLYIPTYAKTVLGMPVSTGFSATLLAGLVLMIIPPISGFLADRFGRTVVALPAALFMAFIAIPLFFWLVAMPDVRRLMALEFVLSITTAFYIGTLPAMLSDMFPVSQRTMGLSLSYNIAVVGAGGFAPLAFALLIKATGSQSAPSFYLVIVALLSGLSVYVAFRKRWLS